MFVVVFLSSFGKNNYLNHCTKEEEKRKKNKGGGGNVLTVILEYKMLNSKPIAQKQNITSFHSFEINP